MNERAVVLLSGGLDSAVMLALAQRERTEIHAVSFDYGQHHDLELIMAAKQAEAANVEHRLIVIDPTPLGGSGLTADIATPRHVPTTPNSRPASYVPARNTLMLSFALALAETTGAYNIYIGANADDRITYPDCREEYFAAYTRMAALGTNLDGHIRVLAPLLNMPKHQIVLLGKELGVDFANTSSCYDPLTSGRPCGGCESCRQRRVSFDRANVTDPLLAP